MAYRPSARRSARRSAARPALGAPDAACGPRSPNAAFPRERKKDRFLLGKNATGFPAIRAYDDQDRPVSYAGASYAYAADGALASKTLPSPGGAYKCRFFHVPPAGTTTGSSLGGMGMDGQGSGRPCPKGSGWWPNRAETINAQP